MSGFGFGYGGAFGSRRRMAVSGATEPTTAQTSITYASVTYSFHSDAACTTPVAMQVGTTAEGYPFVVPHATLTRYFKTDVPSVAVSGSFTGSRINAAGVRSPSSGTTAYSAQAIQAHGLVVNPWMFDGNYESPVGLPQGFDELLSFTDSTSPGPGESSASPYDATLNIDPGYTGVGVPIVPGVNRAYVKFVRRSGTTTPYNWYIGDRYSALNQFASAPPYGAFSPGLSDPDKTVFVTSAQRNKAALGSGFTLATGMPTLAQVTAATPATVSTGVVAGGAFRPLQPYFGQNGEKRRRMMCLHPNYDSGAASQGYAESGYSRDYGQLWADYLAAILATGQAIDDATLNGVLAFGQQLVGNYNRGFASRGGAGQNCGHKQFAMLFGHVFAGVSGVFAKALAIEGNVTHTAFQPVLADVGKGGNFPDSNHQVFMRPYEAEHVGRYQYLLGNVALPPTPDGSYDSEIDTDYETTNWAASFPEMMNIIGLQAAPGGIDGSQVMLANYPAALGYFDSYRTWAQSGLYLVSPYSSRAAAYCDARRNSAAVSRRTMTPDPASEFSGVTAGTGQFAWDYAAMGHATEAITATETEYSMDGVQFVAAGTGTTGAKTGLVPAWRYYPRRRRQSAAGWSPLSYNAPHSNQGVTARATASVTKGSRTVTVASMSSGSPSIRVGDLAAGPGIVPGTYVKAFGTGSGGAGTYTLSMPAYDTQASQQMRLAPMRGMVTPTGTASGTVTWTTQPAICQPKYAGYAGMLFAAAALDGSGIANGTLLICGMGIATGDVQPPTFQWKRDGVAISGETGQGYLKSSADNGHTITCTISSNGQSATTAGIVFAGTAYPAMVQTTFDGTNDQLARSAAFVGAPATVSSLVIAMSIEMLADHTDIRRFIAFGDASGNTTVDNLLLLDRTASGTGGAWSLARGSTNLAAAQNVADGKLTVSDGEQRLMIFVDFANSIFQWYMNDTAIPLNGSVTFGATSFALASVIRPTLFGSLAGTARPNFKHRYTFVDYDRSIDLSVQGNRDKFLPANIGNDGSGVFGSPPLVMAYGDAASMNAGINYGTGGNFTMSGAVA